MKWLLNLIVFLSCTSVFAGEPMLTLNKYYQADCKDFTGTWQGFMTDPTDLFGNGGPWPVTVSLYQQNGKVWGRTTEVKEKNHMIFKANEIWARCSDGKLTDVFWGLKNSCGALSQQGGLVSKNVLALQLNWENAMNGASLVVFLQRKDNLSPYFEPAHMSSYEPGKVTSCH